MPGYEWRGAREGIEDRERRERVEEEVLELEWKKGLAMRSPRQVSVERRLGGRIVVSGSEAGSGWQYQRLNDKGGILSVRPATLLEAHMFQMLCSSDASWLT